jgi:hypothetical protein
MPEEIALRRKRMMADTIEQVTQIEDPRNHSPEVRERLLHLLVSGAPALADPKRADVFEIEDGKQIFYVHAAKASGKVTLLAIWESKAGLTQARTANVA